MQGKRVKICSVWLDQGVDFGVDLNLLEHLLVA